MSDRLSYSADVNIDHVSISSVLFKPQCIISFYTSHFAVASRLSLKIEPPAPPNGTAAPSQSKEDVSEVTNAKEASGSSVKTLQTPGGSFFVPQHRKTRSLGAKWVCMSCQGNSFMLSQSHGNADLL